MKAFFANKFVNLFFKCHKINVPDLVWCIYAKRQNRRGIISYNLATKELADTKFEVLLYCCLSILISFPFTKTNIFLCAKLQLYYSLSKKSFLTHCKWYYVPVKESTSNFFYKYRTSISSLEIRFLKARYLTKPNQKKLPYILGCKTQHNTGINLRTNETGPFLRSKVKRIYLSSDKYPLPEFISTIKWTPSLLYKTLMSLWLWNFFFGGSSLVQITQRKSSRAHHYRE